MVESWQWYSWLSLGASAFAVVLAVVMARRHPGRRAGTTFVAAMSCFFGAACFAYLLRYGSNESGGAWLVVWAARGFYFVHMLAVGLVAAFVGTYFFGFAVFRRRGVATFLYFSLGAAAVFVSSLVTEVTVYGATYPSYKSAQTALAVISTGYGVLMLATIGRTLGSNRDPIIRRQALVMLAGILTHGASAEYYGYLRLTDQLPPPFLSASALVMASTFAIAVLRFRMFEVSPRAEEAVPVPRKFPLRTGRAYVIRERTGENAFRALAEAARRGSPALVVARQPPNAIREDFDLEHTPILWLTTTAGQNHVPPTEPDLLVRLVGEFVDRAEEPFVAMEGLEFLSTYVGFATALHAVEAIGDRVAARGGTFVLSMNPGALDEREESLVDRTFEACTATARAVVEDVFVIHASGLLITHATRRVKPESDRDIMVSMLTAIMNFAKISFAEGSEELRRLELGQKTVLLERGTQIILAVVYIGAQPGAIDEEMRAFLWRAERRFGNILERWNGDVEQVSGIRAMTARLFL